MRNLFDQYELAENRLTHALAICLYEDRDLLHGFLQWLEVRPPIPSNELRIAEQSLPGDPPDVVFDLDEVDRQGLPDIVIHDNSAWCLLIESKVQARLTVEQLTRHERTLRRRGFEEIRCLALTKNGVSAPRDVITKKWSDLYECLGRHGHHSEWSERLRSYLRVAELRLARAGYLTEGTLTMFDGFPFSTENPYTYGESKRLLRLVMKELKAERSLIDLGVDPAAEGRGAITGRGGDLVWDYLSLKNRPKPGAFTAHPHLTVAVHVKHLEVAVTIPNGAARSVGKRLIELGPTGLSNRNSAILRRSGGILKKGAWLEAYAIQRHYPNQRSQAVVDAEMRFKLETSQSSPSGFVKGQTEWADLFLELLRRKRSNIQFGYRVILPWGTDGLDRRDSLRLITDSWWAMKPLLDVIGGV